MTVISRSALVMHSAQAMYDLVNDVASYPQFMDGCAGVGGALLVSTADY